MSSHCAIVASCHEESTPDRQPSLGRSVSERSDRMSRYLQASLGAISGRATSTFDGRSASVSTLRSESTGLYSPVIQPTTYTTSTTTRPTTTPRTLSACPRMTMRRSMAASDRSSIASVQRSYTRRASPRQNSGGYSESTAQASTEGFARQGCGCAAYQSRSGRQSMSSGPSSSTTPDGRPGRSPESWASDVKSSPVFSVSMAESSMDQGDPSPAENTRLMRPLLLDYLARVEPAT